MLEAARIAITAQTARQVNLLLDSMPHDLWPRLQQKLRSLVTSTEKVCACYCALVCRLGQVEDALCVRLLLDSMPQNLSPRLQQKLRSLVTSTEGVCPLHHAGSAPVQVQGALFVKEQDQRVRQPVTACPCARCCLLACLHAAASLQVILDISYASSKVTLSSNTFVSHLCLVQEVTEKLQGFALVQHELQRIAKALSSAAQAKADQQCQSAADTVLTRMTKRCEITEGPALVAARTCRAEQCTQCSLLCRLQS